MTTKPLQMHRFPIPQYDAELVLLHGTADAMASVVASGRVPLQAFGDFVEAEDEALGDAGSLSSWRKAYTGGQFGLGIQTELLKFHMVNGNFNVTPDQHCFITAEGKVMLMSVAPPQ